MEKKCKSCRWWKSGAGGGTENALMFCHHLLETDKRRAVVDGECLSYQKKEQRRKK